MEITLNQENFEYEVLKSDIPVLIDFWATWCGPCRMIAEHISKIADNFNGKVKVCKVNVDEEAILCQKFNIDVIPTIVLVKNGEEAKRASGFMDYEELVAEFSL